MEGTNAFVLDGTLLGFRSLIQVIDDFHRNHRLGLVIEAQVAKGRLSVPPLPLMENLTGRSVTRQLYSSLLGYARSKSFNPASRLSVECIRELVSA